MEKSYAQKKVSTKTVTDLKGTQLSAIIKPIQQNQNRCYVVLTSVILVFLFAFGTIEANAQSSANYTFVTNTTGSLALDMNSNAVDMSTGTTQLIAGGVDEGASSVTNLPFEFWLMANRYTQFSVSSNGIIKLGSMVVDGDDYSIADGTTISPKISAFAAEGATATSNKIHYKVVGAAPNRCLVIEFLMNLYWTFGNPLDGTYQVRLYESTGVVEFVYGAMSISDIESSFDSTTGIGFSTNSTANNFVYVTTATNTATTTGSFTDNPPYDLGPIPNLNSGANGSRRVYRFTPPGSLANVTALNFTLVTQTSMTVNWTAASPLTGILNYAVYRSTDGGSTYTFVNTVNVGTNSLAVTGLAPGTSYLWKVSSVSEGYVSAGATATQATNAPGSITSTGNGNWNSTTPDAPWPGGIVPTNTDNVTIADGSTVTINITTAVCYGLTVGQGASGILRYATTTASVLTVGTNVTIASGGTFSAGTGTLTTHLLRVGGNLTNNGVLDFFTTAGAGITFTGASNNTFGGSGATTDIRTITMNKGTSNANIVELNPTNFTVQGTTTDGTPMAFLTITNGTLKVSGTFSLTGRVFATAAYTIPATGGFWLNNPNFVVAGQNGSPTNNGLLRLTSGTFNIGTVADNAMGAGAGAVFTIEGGTLNVSGRLLSANTITYAQSGGTVNVTTVGNTSSSNAGFGLTSASSVFSMGGGTIKLVQASTGATPVDFQVSGTATVTAGTLEVGTGTTATNFNFRIRGSTPGIVIDNTTNNKTATFVATTIINGNVLVNTGTNFNLNGFLVAPGGATFTNNGTVTGTAAGSRLYFLGNGFAQTYTGSGVVTAPLGSIELDNTMGLTLDPAISNIITARVILFAGGVTNANKLTLGNGGATLGTIQIGNTTTPTAAGTFDVPLTFNLGTGGQTVSYLRTNTSYTVGPEINPSRVLTSLTYDDNNVSHSLTLAGGNLSTGSLTLTNGKINTNGSNILTVSGTTVASVVRTNGYINGPLERTLPASLGSGSTYLFPVGKSAYTPLELVNPTTNAGGNVVLQAEEFDGATGGTAGIGMMSLNTDVYWNASITSGAGNFTNTKIRLTDAGIGAADAIAKSATQTGSYDFIGGNSVGIPVNTITSDAFTSFSFFVMGVKTPPSCVTPTTVTVTGITLSMADVSFVCPSCSGSYIAEYGLPGFTPGTTGVAGTGGTVVTGPASPIGLSGLSSSTTYEVYVRQDCGLGSYSTNSTVQSFTTICGTFSIPYTEDFDDVVDPSIPVCSVVEDLNGATSWNTATVNPRSAPNSLDYNYDVDIPGDDWWFTPGFTLSGSTSYRLTFWYRARSDFYPEALEVQYGSTQDAVGMTSPVIFSNTFIDNETYIEAVIDFTPSSSGVYYIGFHAISEPDEFDLHVDDISFDVSPSCLEPTTIAVGSITTTSASVSFSSSGDSFIVEYGATGFTPGTDGTPGTGGTVVTGAASPIALSGLTDATTYDVYVRQECSGPMYSANSTVTQFQTLCNPTNVPYLENFDGVTSPTLPLCTSKEDVNGVTTWNTIDFNANSSPNALIYDYDIDTPADDWFFTAPLNLTGDTTYTLTFVYRVESDIYTEALEVRYGTTPTADAMSGGILLFSDTDLINTEYQQFTVDFTPMSTDTFYLGFHAISLADQWNLYVDDIFVTHCSHLVTNFSDNDPGSLRDIVECASPGATITFDDALMNQTITLTSGEIEINKNLIFSGLGMMNLTISGNGTSRIFHLGEGKTLEIGNMSLEDGYGLTNGGALFVEGNLILENVLFDNNFEDATRKSMTVTSTATVEVVGNVIIED